MVSDLVCQTVLSADEHSVRICVDVLALDADGPVSWVSKLQADGVVALFVYAFFKSVIIEDLEGAVLVADTIVSEWLESAAAVD